MENQSLTNAELEKALQQIQDPDRIDMLTNYFMAEMYPVTRNSGNHRSLIFICEEYKLTRRDLILIIKCLSLAKLIGAIRK